MEYFFVSKPLEYCNVEKQVCDGANCFKKGENAKNLLRLLYALSGVSFWSGRLKYKKVKRTIKEELEILDFIIAVAEKRKPKLPSIPRSKL